MAGMDSTRLHTLNFLRNKRLIEEARVLGVKSNGFLVLVPRYMAIVNIAFFNINIVYSGTELKEKCF